MSDATFVRAKLAALDGQYRVKEGFLLAGKGGFQHEIAIKPISFAVKDEGIAVDTNNVDIPGVSFQPHRHMGKGSFTRRLDVLENIDSGPLQSFAEFTFYDDMVYLSSRDTPISVIPG